MVKFLKAWLHRAKHRGVYPYPPPEVPPATHAAA